jgi:hypothetical protein
MASVIDSFRDTFEDNLSFLKLIIFALPVYFGYSLSLHANGDYTVVWIIGLITAFFMLGYIAQITHGMLNDAERVLPKLNPITMAVQSLKVLISAGPFALILYGIGCWILSFFKDFPIEWISIVVQVIIGIVVAGLAVTSFLLYAKKQSVIAAYNLKKLSERAGDIMIGIIFLVVQFAVVNVLTVGFLAYTISVLFMPGPLLYAFCSYALVFNLAALGHFLAQVGYETINYD